jgi:hypothetical protein
MLPSVKKIMKFSSYTIELNKLDDLKHSYIIHDHNHVCTENNALAVAAWHSGHIRLRNPVRILPGYKFFGGNISVLFT